MTAVVTGSASGTGVYMVNALAKESDSTVVVKKNVDGANAVVTHAEKERGECIWVKSYTDEPDSWLRLRIRSPSTSLILFVPFISFSSLFMIAIILSASDFEVNRDITKHEFEDVLNISPLSCPAAIFFGNKSFSIKAISILN